jgi:hypothetical protein
MPLYHLVDHAHYIATQNLKPKSRLFEPLTAFILSVLQENMLRNPYQSMTDESIMSRFGRRRKSRKISQYVQFCRYMRENQPDLINLQEIWKTAKNEDWKKRFAKQSEESLSVDIVTDAIKEEQKSESDSSSEDEKYEKPLPIRVESSASDSEIETNSVKLDSPQSDSHQSVLSTLSYHSGSDSDSP